MISSDEYYDEIEHELYRYSDDDDHDTSLELTREDWQDWNSEELLNVWMSIIEYHEYWYLPVRKTFNEFCEFVFDEEDDDDGLHALTPPPPEVQAVKFHPFIKGRNWNKFFFSR